MRDLKAFQCPNCGFQTQSQTGRTCPTCDYTGDWIQPGETETYAAKRSREIAAEKIDLGEWREIHPEIIVDYKLLEKQLDCLGRYLDDESDDYFHLNGLYDLLLAILQTKPFKEAN